MLYDKIFPQEPTLEVLPFQLEAEKSLHEFIRQAWHVLEPGREFVDGWHIGAVAEHLEAIESGQIKRLIINQPPGSMKSLEVCVFWFCWAWIHRPHLRWLYTTHAQAFALRDSAKCRDLIKSPWYQLRWGNKFQLRTDIDSVTKFANDRTGYRLATSGATGERADRIVSDDALKIEEAHYKMSRAQVNNNWDQVMSRRGADKDSAFVVIMQRLWQDDLTGHLLSKESGYVHLMLPMEFESSRRCVTTFGPPGGTARVWSDPRTQEGELLCPARFPLEEVIAAKKDLGAYGISGQFQQNPTPGAEGGIFSNFQHFSIQDKDGLMWFCLPDGRRYTFGECKWIQTVDTAMKTKEENDYTVVGTFARTKQWDILIVDICRKKVLIPDQYEFVLGQKAKWPLVEYIAIEDKASGTGLIQTGRSRGTPFRELKADKEKTRRAAEAATKYRNGQVYHRQGAAWLADFETELIFFPKGEHDDQVDVVAHACNELRSGIRMIPWIR